MAIDKELGREQSSLSTYVPVQRYYIYRADKRGI